MNIKHKEMCGTIKLFRQEDSYNCKHTNILAEETLYANWVKFKWTLNNIHFVNFSVTFYKY